MKREKYWLFQGVPDKYDLRAAIRDKSGWWPTCGRDIRCGDRVIFWKGKKKEATRGIIAFGEVLTDPEPHDPRDPHWLKPVANEMKEIEMVEVRYVHLSNLPIWYEDNRYQGILHPLRIIRFAQKTVDDVSAEQWEKIVLAAGGWPNENASVEDAREAVAEFAGRPNNRQVYRLNSDERRAIEKRAMDEAQCYYKKYWPHVYDVSTYEPYDLHCRNESGKELLVEVKGTTSEGFAVLLTPNEVDNARKHAGHVALFVLHSIVLGKDELGAPVATGGTCIVYNSWEIDTGILKPIGYEYTLPSRSND